MLLPLRHELIGRYCTQRFRIGNFVECGMRGPVRIVGLTDAKIPWPIGQAAGKGARGPVVYQGLERALRLESNVAICHWWGVTAQTVRKWRKALGIGPHTKGSLRLRAAYGADPERAAARAEGFRSADLTEARARMAETKRGVPRPASVKRKLRKANLGKKASPETRQKMREAAARRRKKSPDEVRIREFEQDVLQLSLSMNGISAVRAALEAMKNDPLIMFTIRCGGVENTMRIIGTIEQRAR